MSSTVQKNSELLYLYDAVLCNPNGDPDEENKPRMDYDTRRNLVSDVRFKRYLRDYWLTFDEEEWRRLGYDKQDVWVREVEDQTGLPRPVSAKQRIETLAKEFGARSATEVFRNPEFLSWLCQRMVDIRFFGAAITIGGKSRGRNDTQDSGEEKKGDSLQLTGPVQFSWGYSLNKADILSSTISSRFSGRDQGEKGKYGTFGKDYRVKFSLLAFYGVVNATRAGKTLLTERDVLLLDYSLITALPLMATTRSKLGQMPRLYMRVQYKDDLTILGDFRTGIHLDQQTEPVDIRGVNLSYTGLLEKLRSACDRIDRIVLWYHPELPSGSTLHTALKDEGFTVGDVRPPTV